FVCQVVSRLSNRLACVARSQLLFQRSNLGAHGLDLIDAVRDCVHLFPQRRQQFCLRLDVALVPAGMWILQDSQLLAKLPFANGQPHRVGSRRRQQRYPSNARGGPPAFRPYCDIRRIQRAGSQLNLGARLEPQIPPITVDPLFPFPRPSSRTAFSPSTARTTPP